jgi:LysR family nitrogen assimilation transcriptional regulator
MEALPLFEECFMVFGAPAKMRRRPKVMAFAQVAKLELAEPDGAHDLRKIIERAASRINARLNVRYELNSPQMLSAVVREGLAYSIMPPSACVDAVAAGAIVGRAIKEPELSRVQAVVWPRDRPLTAAAEAIRDTLVHIVAELVAQGRLHGRMLAPNYKKK